MMNINKIFSSFDGEVSPHGQGRLATFVRLQGCNLNCPYCDTKESVSQETNHYMDAVSVFNSVVQKGFRKVTITGGEPLLQRESVIKLSQWLSEKNFLVTIETNGTCELLGPGERGEKVAHIVDMKLHDFELAEKCANRFLYYDQWLFTPQDFIKIPVSNAKQLELLAEYIPQLVRLRNPKIAVSPVMTNDFKVDYSLVKGLYFLMRDYKLDWFLNCQIHKFMNLP